MLVRALLWPGGVQYCNYSVCFPLHWLFCLLVLWFLVHSHLFCRFFFIQRWKLTFLTPDSRLVIDFFDKQNSIELVYWKFCDSLLRRSVVLFYMLWNIHLWDCIKGSYVIKIIENGLEKRRHPEICICCNNLNQAERLVKKKSLVSPVEATWRPWQFS